MKISRLVTSAADPRCYRKDTDNVVHHQGSGWTSEGSVKGVSATLPLPGADETHHEH
jgi:hypothetical protein